MKIIKIIVGILVCISLIRAINNAEPLSTYELLMQIEKADFKIVDYEYIENMIESFEEYEDYNTKSWDKDLSGIDGFLENLKNVFVLGAIKFFEIIAGTGGAIINTLKNILKGGLDLLKIALYICGFTS